MCEQVDRIAFAMAGLLSFSAAGIGFFVVSFAELFLARFPRHVTSLLLSSIFLIYSLLSLFSSSDPLSSVLPLPLLSLSLLFLLRSLSPLLPIPLPSPLLSLLSLSASLLELLLLSLRRVDPTGVESRYFSLLSVPALLFLLSSLPSPFSPAARAAGLSLHGTWLLQMAFSPFHPSSVAHGCSLKRGRGWSSYSLHCGTHADYHRARALATLQFNCHLALLLVAGVAIYAFLAARNGPGALRGGYRPIGKDVQLTAAAGAENGSSRFVLDSDDDEEGGKAATETNGLA